MLLFSSCFDHFFFLSLPVGNESQMGVFCMAVHVPAGEGGRVVIVTGGDDQAICVAELEVVAVLDDGRCSPTTQIASDRGPSSSQGSRGQGGDEVPARKRCGASFFPGQRSRLVVF